MGAGNARVRRRGRKPGAHAAPEPGRPRGEPPPPLLPWERRVRVIRGVASGLVCLHEEWEQLVVHRDVKASNSNVLLGADMGARLGDFGLARLCYEHGTDPPTTRIVDRDAGVHGPRAHRDRQGHHGHRRVRLLRPGAPPHRPRHRRQPPAPWCDLVRAVDERLDGRFDKEEAKLVAWCCG
ncbi:hypothetical protein ACP4OV_024721 [Aristida adscensionis]